MKMVPTYLCVFAFCTWLGADVIAQSLKLRPESLPLNGMLWSDGANGMSSTR